MDDCIIAIPKEKVTDLLKDFRNFQSKLPFTYEIYYTQHKRSHETKKLNQNGIQNQLVPVDTSPLIQIILLENILLNNDYPLKRIQRIKKTTHTEIIVVNKMTFQSCFTLHT